MALALLLATSLAAPAQAFFEVDLEGTYVLGGADIAWAGHGATLGAELSVVRLDGWTWIGAYSGLGWDFARDVGRAALGVEMGEGVVGLDVALRVDTDAYIDGIARLMVTIGLGSIYGGYAFGERPRTELGLLLKVPYQLD